MVFNDGRRTPNLLLLVHVNDNYHLQSSFVQEITDDLISCLPLWVEDMVIAGTDVTQFHHDTNSVLDLCVH